MNQERFSDGIYLITSTGCTWDRSDSKFYNAYGSKERGKEDRFKWWIDDHRPPTQAPGQGQPPHRLRYFAQSPAFLRKDPSETLGPRLIIDQILGPWTLKGYYRRRSETAAVHHEDTTRGGEVEAVKNADPFWDWYPDFSARLEQRLQTVNTQRSVAGLLGMLVQSLRQSNRILLSPDMSVPDGDWMSEVVGAVYGHSETDATISEKTWGLKMQLVEKQSATFNAALKKIDQCTVTATNALAEILADLDQACKLYEGRHPEVLIYRQTYRQLALRLPLEMAVASGDYRAFQAAVEGLHDQTVPAQIRLWEAQLLLQRGDAVEALFAARDALAGEPANADAKRICCEIEASFIGSSLRKAHGAIEDARAAFYKYLKERGYDKDEPKNAWLGQLWSPLRYIDSEMAWAAFTSGASNIAVLFGADRAAEEQRGLSAYEASMTRAYLGLQTILRLSMRGYTMSNIVQMHSGDLQRALPLKHISGAAYTPQEVDGLRALIHEAVKNLPDIQALADDDLVELKSAVQKGYWDPKDVGNTWAEWIGDLSSPKNLFLLLAPYSVAAVGGKTVGVANWGWGLTEAERSIQAAEGITSGTEMISTAIGWDRAMKAFGGTEEGERLLALMEKMNRYEKGLGLALPNASAGQQLLVLGNKAAWYGSKFIGTMVVVGLAAHGVEEIGGEKARFIVDAFLVLAQDHELMQKLLQSGKIDPKRTSKLIHETYIPFCQAAQQKIEEANARNIRLRAILDLRQKGQTLLPDQIQFLDEAFERGAVPARLIPNGEPIHDSLIASQRAVAETRGADPLAGQYPLKAAEKMKPRVVAKKHAVQEKLDDAETTADKLDQLVVTAPIVTAPKPLSEKVSLPEWFEYRSEHPTPFSHKSNVPKIQEGDQALLDGEPDKALRLYEEAQSGLTAGNPEAEMLERRLKLAHAIDETPRPAGPTGEFVERAELEPAEVDAVLSREAIWRGTPLGEQGTHSTIYDDGKYLIKELEVGYSREGVELTPAYLEQTVEAEQVVTDLARALGLDVPAVHARILRDAEGNFAKVQFIYRRVAGKSLEKATPELVFQFRQEIAGYAVLGNLVNDYDRHAGNYVEGGGRIVGLDWGAADPRGLRLRQINALGKELTPGSVADRYVSGFGGRDHWFIRAHNKLVNLQPSAAADLDGVATTLRTLVAEEALTFKAAEGMLRKVDNLLADQPGLERLLTKSYSKVHGSPAELEAFGNQVRKTFGPDANVQEHFESQIKEMVDQTVENLKWRHKYLESTLKGFDTRDHLPVPKGDSSRWVPSPALEGEAWQRMVLHEITGVCRLRRAA